MIDSLQLHSLKKILKGFIQDFPIGGFITSESSKLYCRNILPPNFRGSNQQCFSHSFMSTVGYLGVLFHVFFIIVPRFTEKPPSALLPVAEAVGIKALNGVTMAIK